jgi:structural maintenance of chromosome 2
MAYVFGDTLICDDAESAKRVTFSKEVNVKSVTLDGDVYDPSGTLSGGSAPSGNGILVAVQELHKAESALREARDTLERLEGEAERGRTKRDQWRKLSGELEIKEHQMGLLEAQIEGGNAARVRKLCLGVRSGFVC